MCLCVLSLLITHLPLHNHTQNSHFPPISPPPKQNHSDRLSTLLKELEGKDIDELIKEGSELLATFGGGGGGGAAAAPAAGAAAGGDDKKEDKKKKEEKEEEADLGGGMDMFGGGGDGY